MARVALYTLGCKVNQYETRKIAEEFQSNGFELVDFADQADVYVVNTCTVTQTADSKSRQAARAAAKRNPQAAVIVTGCYAETSPGRARSIEGVDMVLGNRYKPQLVDLVMSAVPVSAEPHRTEDAAPVRNGRTRALLKIQDGCSRFCAYCAVPLARPVMSCRPCEEVLSEARELAGRGFKEIVLTGIRLGVYRDGDADLSDLASAIAEIGGIERIRLSSIELTDIPDSLVDLMAASRKLCRHLHIPLQSGDDDILAKMNRPYAASEFASFVEHVREAIPGIAITTDIMVGFPGETERQFESSYRFAERMRFARTHVFRYSPRPGTAAAEMKDDVPACEKSRRSEVMMDLAARCSNGFASGLIGEVLPVLVEGKQVKAKIESGLTDNYVRVVFPGTGHAGDIVNVRVESVTEAEASGWLMA